MLSLIYGLMSRLWWIYCTPLIHTHTHIHTESCLQIDTNTKSCAHQKKKRWKKIIFIRSLKTLKTGCAQESFYLFMMKHRTFSWKYKWVTLCTLKAYKEQPFDGFCLTEQNDWVCIWTVQLPLEKPIKLFKWSSNHIFIDTYWGVKAHD